MNHRPFEDWLLDDETLSVQQERELQIHLRSCTSCSAIAGSNVALHARRMVAPAEGFSERFQPRLARWKRQQQRRQAIGTIVLVLAGVIFLYVLAGPLLAEAVESPAAWLSKVTGYFVAFLTAARVVEQVGGILFRHIPSLITPSAWAAVLASGGMLSLFWISIMRRLARAPQGV